MPRVETTGVTSQPPVAASATLLGQRAGWASRAVVGLPESLTAAVTGFCLPLMIVLLSGHFTKVWTLPLGLVGAVVAVCTTRAPREQVTRSSVGYTLAAAAFAVIWFGYNLRYTAQDVYATRDPATYTIAGRWLVNHASLVIHTHPELFGSPPGAQLGTDSYWNVSSDVVNAQANHLLPALLGLAGSTFGTGVIFKANVAIGALALLVFFGLARRVVNGPLALLAMAVIAVSMPFIYVSRDTFTEPLTMLFLIGSLALLMRALASHRIAEFALAGLAAGSAAMVRVDSYTALVAVIVAAALLVASAPAGAHRGAVVRGLTLLAGAGVTGLVGWLDLVHLSRQYYGSQHHNIMLALFAVFVVLVAAPGAVALAWRPTARRWLTRDDIRRRASTGAIAVLVAVFVGLATRPLWTEGHGGFNQNLVNMQRRWNAAVDGTRTYSEQTVHWLAMYLGWPTVVLAVAGYALLIVALIRRRAYALCAAVTMGLSMSALYLWNSEITPDQPWAMRRYVPVIVPLLVLAAAVAIQALWRSDRWRAVLRPPAAAVAVIALVLPAVTSWPMRHVREEVPQLGQLQALCSAIGSNGAVVLVDEAAFVAYGQTLRSFCDVPAIGLVDASPTQVSAMNASVTGHGRELFVLSQDRAAIESATGLTVAVFSTVTVQRWPNQIDVAPDQADAQTTTVFLTALDASGSAHVVLPVKGGS